MQEMMFVAPSNAVFVTAPNTSSITSSSLMGNQQQSAPNHQQDHGKGGLGGVITNLFHFSLHHNNTGQATNVAGITTNQSSTLPSNGIQNNNSSSNTKVKEDLFEDPRKKAEQRIRKNLQSQIK
jgi:hypothetical protein